MGKSTEPYRATQLTPALAAALRARQAIAEDPDHPRNRARARRAATIVRLRAEGVRVEEIAADFDLTRQRVYQILAAEWPAGVPMPPAERRKATEQPAFRPPARQAGLEGPRQKREPGAVLILAV